MISETRLGDFIKFFATYFLTKVAQIISNFSGYIEKLHSYVTIAKATSWVTFGNIWATFYSTIWSHWSRLGCKNVHLGRSVGRSREALQFWPQKVAKKYSVLAALGSTRIGPSDN